MKQQNIFTKGIIDDLAPNLIKPDNWIFPTHNIRIYNKRGQGFVVSTMPGNEVKFEITEGFHVLAAEEHRGIIYVISLSNTTHEGEHFTEIGCFPYPEAWWPTPAAIDPTQTGFVQEYGQLRNYSSHALNMMITTKFGFTLESEIKLIIDDAFDESANLYICDGVNSDKAVNVGFRKDGSLNEVIYDLKDFEGKINHILYSLHPVRVENLSVVKGGQLRPGQWHLFFCYKTASFDKTEYNSESFPVSIAEGSSLTGTNGLLNDDNGTPEYVNKKLILDLENVDTGYSYISVGVVRFYGQGLGQLEYEEFEIAKEFMITGSSMTIQITGDEEEVVLDTDSLFSEYIKERISKDHCFFSSRIWKANLIKDTYDKTLFTDLALMVTVEAVFDTLVDTPGYDDIVNGSLIDPMNMQDPEFIYKTLGYFDNEIYPFGVRFLLKNGVTTDVYPILGNDELFGGTNDMGLFRSRIPPSSLDVVSVKFGIAAMINTINNDSTYDKIEGFYIVRGERIKNLLYDGAIARTANGVRVSKNRKTFMDGIRQWGDQCWYYNQEDLWFASEEQENAYHVPVFRFDHTINGQTYPLKNNPVTFPHATYNDNGGDRSTVESAVLIGSLEDMLRDHKDPRYEYSLAVENPAYIEDNNQTGVLDPQGDKDTYIDYEDAIDTKLKMSEDHFALFSPDFMTEADHLTNNGNDYWIEVYARYDKPCYSIGTMERMVDGGRPSRTRVFEMGSCPVPPEIEYFTTTLQKVIEILINGTSTDKDIPAVWITGCPDDYYTVSPWIEGNDYFGTAAPTGIIDISPDVFDDRVVSHGGLNYLCIKNTVLVSPAPEPGVDTDYWVEIDSITIYSSERGAYEFPLSIYVVDYSGWALGSCITGTYEVPATPPPDAFVPLDPVEATLYNIEKGTYQGRGHFSSYAEDGKEYKVNGKKGLYSLTGYFSCRQNTAAGAIDLYSELVHYNRSYQTPAYMGIVFEGLVPADDSFTYMARVYKEDPTSATYFTDHVAAFTPEYTQYWNISDLIELDGPTADLQLYKGDSFKTMSWFRMARHVDFDDNIEDGHQSLGFQSWYRTGLVFKPQKVQKSGMVLDNSYNHGILYGMITNNRRNVTLRTLLNLVDADSNDVTYSFFPRVADTDSVMGWIYSSSSANDYAESVNINDGYNDTSGFLKVLGVDLNLPYDSDKKSTRIAFSDRRIVESYKDGYRSIGLLNKQDFETNYGEIMRIEEVFGLLMTVRERAITKHFVGDIKLTEEVSINTSDIYLSEETSIISYYGIQDFHAFLKTKNSIYGVDVRNAIIWKSGVKYSDYGKKTPSTQILSRQLAVERKVTEFIDTLSADRTTPIMLNGISMGYNEDYSEIYITFLNGEIQNTIIYSEMFGFFTGTADITASLYIPFERKVLSVINDPSAGSKEIYVNDVPGVVTTFYGSDRDNILSFVVNGNSQEENTTAITKIFEHLEIICPRHMLDRIGYETEIQEGFYTFTSDSEQFWKDAEWREGAWFVPIIREIESGEDEYYLEDSVLRGKWVKITLYFRADEEFTISSIITEFKQSFV